MNAMNGMPETRDPIEAGDDPIVELAPAPRRRLLAMKALGVALVLSFPAALAWNGEKVGEAREAELALEEGRPADPASARFVAPWDWSPAERDSLGPNLRAAIASLWERPKAPASAPAPAPSGDLARAMALVRRGDALWRAQQLTAAREKLVVAKRLLEPLAVSAPDDADVAKTLRLCDDLIDDIDKR